MDVKGVSDIFRELVLQVSKNVKLEKQLAFGLKVRLSGLASSGRKAGVAGFTLGCAVWLLMCHEEGIKLD